MKVLFFLRYFCDQASSRVRGFYMADELRRKGMNCDIIYGYGKKVYAIDVFDPSLDKTMSRSGIKAGDVYEAFLEGRSMLEAYQESTRDFGNIITIREDSKKVSFPEEQNFIFGFVDGCHQQAYVENDFYVIWPHLVSGGVVGFHDYKFDDWPEVTKAADKLIHKHKREISAVYEIEGKYNILSLLLIKK